MVLIISATTPYNTKYSHPPRGGCRRKLALEPVMRRAAAAGTLSNADANWECVSVPCTASSCASAPRRGPTSSIASRRGRCRCECHSAPCGGLTFVGADAGLVEPIDTQENDASPRAELANALDGADASRTAAWERAACEDALAPSDAAAGGSVSKDDDSVAAQLAAALFALTGSQSNAEQIDLSLIHI